MTQFKKSEEFGVWKDNCELNTPGRFTIQEVTNYYYMRDHLGSVREMVTGSGQIVSEATYDPYGVATVSGTVTPTFQYAGYYAHQGSGLNLTWYRGYDPVIGRWQARDPLKNAEMREGMNLYEYCDNNPVKEDNDLGLFPVLPFHWHGNYGGPGWSNGGSNSESGKLPRSDEWGYKPPVPGDEEDACY